MPARHSESVGHVRHEGKTYGSNALQLFVGSINSCTVHVVWVNMETLLTYPSVMGFVYGTIFMLFRYNQFMF